MSTETEQPNEVVKLNLYQKLAEIQREVKGLGKDKQGQNYTYVTGIKVLEHVKPLMIKHGILLKQEIISIENVRQDYLTSLNQNPETKAWNGKPKTEILSKVMQKFTWIDCETGDKDENLFGANGQNDWDKGVGSALTYAERYFLLKFFHINTDEDDIDNPERKAEEAAEAEKARTESENLAKENERLQGVQNMLDECTAVDTLGITYRALTESDQALFKKYVGQLTKKLTAKNNTNE